MLGKEGKEGDVFQEEAMGRRKYMVVEMSLLPWGQAQKLVLCSFWSLSVFLAAPLVPFQIHAASPRTSGSRGPHPLIRTLQIRSCNKIP